jgi:hypothetical protein
MQIARPYNASNVKHVKNRKKNAELELQQEKDAMSFVMKHPLGRRFVWALLEKAGVNSQSFTPDRELTAFNCGQRNIGLMLQAEIEESFPNEFILMWSEHLKQGIQEEEEDTAVRTESILEEGEHEDGRSDDE